MQLWLICFLSSSSPLFSCCLPSFPRGFGGAGNRADCQPISLAAAVIVTPTERPPFCILHKRQESESGSRNQEPPGDVKLETTLG